QGAGRGRVLTTANSPPRCRSDVSRDFTATRDRRAIATYRRPHAAATPTSKRGQLNDTIEGAGHTFPASSNEAPTRHPTKSQPLRYPGAILQLQPPRSRAMTRSAQTAEPI